MTTGDRYEATGTYYSISGEEAVDAFRQAVRAAALEEAAKVCEEPVETLQLPETPQYDGDIRPIERRMCLALAAAIRLNALKETR